MNRLKFKTVLLILIACLSLAEVSEGISDANSLTTLPDYLSHAALNNAELKSKFEEWKAALEQIPQAKALDDPKFTYSYFIEEVETRVGPQENKFGIMQTFPWFGEIKARTDAASARAKAAQQRYESAKLRLFQQVKDAYYEFSYLATAIEIAKENLELLKHFEEVARAKYRTSEASHPDVIRAQIELAKLEDILNSLKKLKEPTVVRLNSILNRQAGEDLDWPQKQTPFEVKLIREDIISKIIRLNPELSELNWQTAAARAEVELAKKKFYPDMGIGVDWIQTGDARTGGVSGSGQDAVALMFSINIPLWHDSYKAAERQARAKVRSYQQKKIDVQNKKIFQALQVIYNIEDSKRKMDLYGTTLVSKAQELVQSSEAAYRSGTIDFLSLIDAQRMLLKYQLNHERAIIDNQQSIAELESLTGRQL
jgi:outer membrane protein TolC